MSEEYHRFHLRVPKETWEELEALAKRKKRSVTAQILVAIERMLQKEVEQQEKAP